LHILGPEEGPPRKKIKSPPAISPTGSSTSLYSGGSRFALFWRFLDFVVRNFSIQKTPETNMIFSIDWSKSFAGFTHIYTLFSATTGTTLDMQGTRVTRTQYGFRTLQESSAKMCLKVTG
jgi:hypothetical protein